MHEQTFIQSIIKPIKDKEKVASVELELGELVGIEPDHLHEHLIDETGWKVKINEKKSKVKCSCGYEGQAQIRESLHDMVIYCCPKCGKTPEVLEGKDVKIIKVIYK
jgi:Zn finger protein HypA/HybF involved in hydrogenase expression